uniref:Protein PFC0760c-like n=1 Tax=Dermatophagoides pteronyssinus TaxID=6956 RepID=A0A6P6XTC0_DERPT|nr:protein PFC0760c-like [Dermatophagoides pteronyssinus]
MSHHSLSQYGNYIPTPPQPPPSWPNYFKHSNNKRQHFCKTIVRTVDDATAHLTNIHRIEQTTIDYENKTKEEEKSILVESKIDDDFSNKYDQKDCDDGDELTSSQNHFLHDDTDSDLYHERFNNTLSSFSIESENKLDNTIELSSDVEEIEETIVDDHQSAGTIFTLTNNNDDEDFSNEYDQNIENEKSDDLFEATTKSKTTNDPFTKNNDNQKTIENFPNDESSSSSTTNDPFTKNNDDQKTIDNFSNYESSSLSSSSQLIIESSEVEEVEEAIVDDHQSTNDEDNKTKEKSLTTRSNSTIVEFEYDQVKKKISSFLGRIIPWK